MSEKRIIPKNRRIIKSRSIRKTPVSKSINSSSQSLESSPDISLNLQKQDKKVEKQDKEVEKQDKEVEKQDKEVEKEDKKVEKEDKKVGKSELEKFVSDLGVEIPSDVDFNKMENIKDIYGNKLFLTKKKMNRIELYELFTQSYIIGSKEIFDTINSRDKWDSIKEILYRLNTYSSALSKQNKYIESFKTKPAGISGVYKCPRCSSDETIYRQLQVRSADEPMTTFVTCLSCNYQFTD
jgi:DNA-directed RNA polymerase subunit M/transcription elongation factor TFIIS